MKQAPAIFASEPEIVNKTRVLSQVTFIYIALLTIQIVKAAFK